MVVSDHDDDDGGTRPLAKGRTHALGIVLKSRDNRRTDHSKSFNCLVWEESLHTQLVLRSLENRLIAIDWIWSWDR